MVPLTYPSSYVTYNGETGTIVYQLESTAGLIKWVDYIPVKFLTADPPETNTYNNEAARLVDVLLNVTGKQAGLDYVLIYEDEAATRAWVVEDDGYIPCFKVSDFISNNLELENDFNLLQENGYLILLET